jgi:hypothetical protein
VILVAMTRIHRTLSMMAVAVCAFAHPARAQQGRPFEDSWFWGLKMGGLGLADTTGTYKQAPLAGVDWLITRSKAALYVSFAQSFSTQTAEIPMTASILDTTKRVVDVQDVRQVELALLGFPGEHTRFHPYIGGGFVMDLIGSASPRGPFVTRNDQTFALQTVDSLKFAFAPMFIVGGQLRFKPFSIFGQGNVSMAPQNFLVGSTRSIIFAYELGVRYNIGSSIAKDY